MTSTKAIEEYKNGTFSQVGQTRCDAYPTPRSIKEWVDGYAWSMHAGAQPTPDVTERAHFFFIPTATPKAASRPFSFAWHFYIDDTSYHYQLPFDDIHPYLNYRQHSRPFQFTSLPPKLHHKCTFNLIHNHNFVNALKGEVFIQVNRIAKSIYHCCCCCCISCKTCSLGVIVQM